MQFTGKLNNYVCLYAQFRHRAQKTMQLGALYSNFAILCYLYLDYGWIQTSESRNITEISLKKYNQFDKVTAKSYVIGLDLQSLLFPVTRKKWFNSNAQFPVNLSTILSPTGHLFPHPWRFAFPISLISSIIHGYLQSVFHPRFYGRNINFIPSRTVIEISKVHYMDVYLWMFSYKSVDLWTVYRVHYF